MSDDLVSGFNAGDVDPSSDFTPIPDGVYRAMIVESESKRNKKDTGSYLKLKFQICDGQHEGRFLFANLNLDNPNQQAVDIARRDLSAICRAIDVYEPKGMNDLHDKILGLKVTVERRKDNDSLGNVIKAYLKADSVEPGTVVTGGDSDWMQK